MYCIKKLGAGSYGVLYECIDSQTNMRYAVKRNLVNKPVEFFGAIRELDILAMAREHPYIIKLLSVRPNTSGYMGKPMSPTRDYRDDTLHFAFELAQWDMDNHLRKQATDYAQLKLMMLHILLAVEYLHLRGVAHRDIKPSNLLIVYDDKSKGYVCKLGDVGMAKHVVSGCVKTKDLGTICYRSPECAQGKPDDIAGDIWALGCVFYEMFLRKIAFHCNQDSNESILATQRLRYSRLFINEAPADVKAFDNIPGPKWVEVESIIKSCLTMEVKDRPSVSAIINLPAFNAFRDHINDIRAYFAPPTSAPSALSAPSLEGKHQLVHLPILSPHAQLRCEITMRLIELYKLLAPCKWFRIRIFFTAINLFDRYFHWIDHSAVHKSSSDMQLLTMRDGLFALMVCLYMSMNYHIVSEFNWSFQSMVTQLIPELRAADMPSGNTLVQIGMQVAQVILAHVAQPGTIYEHTPLEHWDKIKGGKRELKFEIKGDYKSLPLPSSPSQPTIIPPAKTTIIPVRPVALGTGLPLVQNTLCVPGLRYDPESIAEAEHIDLMTFYTSTPVCYQLTAEQVVQLWRQHKAKAS